MRPVWAIQPTLSLKEKRGEKPVFCAHKHATVKWQVWSLLPDGNGEEADKP